MIYVFGCPVCRKTFRNDQPGEPMCTGPSEMRHDHEPVLMRLISEGKTEIHPMLAERRANGPLIITCS